MFFTVLAPAYYDFISNEYYLLLLTHDNIDYITGLTVVSGLGVEMLAEICAVCCDTLSATRIPFIIPALSGLCK
jgi:hypothetical protein